MPGDLIGGLMLAAIAVPEQLATARLAGFPPEAGLYAFIAGSLAFAVFGANPYISVGADSTIAPIFAGTLATLVGATGAAYVPLAGALAVAVGLVLVGVGLARAGWIAALLSVPVTVGFLAGIAVHIVAGQLPALLGLPDSSGAMLVRLWRLLTELGGTNAWDLAVGASVFGLAVACARINKRIPGALLGLVVAAVAASAFSFERRGVHMLGALQARLPALHALYLPHAGDVGTMLPLTLVVAAVCIMQTAAVGRSFPTKPEEGEDSSSDFFAVGAGSVLAGFLGAFPVDSSPPRTAIVKAAGGASQVAALVAVAAIGAVIVVASPLLASVPQAALAGVLVFIATHIFRLSDMVRIAKYSRREFTLLVVGALFVIVLPIQTGMLLAIMLSLAHGVQLMMWPPATELVQVTGSTTWWPVSDAPGGLKVPGIVVFSPAAPINFTNARFLHDWLLATITKQQAPVHLVVIEASGVTDFDYTGSQSLQKTIVELRSRGIDVAIAHMLVTHAQQAAQRSGLIATLGEDHVFMSVHEAVATLGKEGSDRR